MKNIRQQKIMDILKTGDYVSVQSLSETLFVSLPTVRRDLTELEREGFVRRSHGGAMAVSALHGGMPFDFRWGKNLGVKAKMSKSAAELIRDGDTVFIDGSTSCQRIADNLKELHSLTVVTNSITVAWLVRRYDFKNYCTGGELLKSSMSYIGRAAERFVGAFCFDRMFFSSSAVSDRGIISDYSQQETELRARVMDCSREKIFLCDGSKLGRNDSFFLCNAADCDVIISDITLPFETKNSIIC